MKILYLPNQYSQQRQRQKPVYIYPVLMAMEAQWYRKNGHDVDWAIPWPTYNVVAGGDNSYDKVITEPEGLDFLSLPIPDRTWSGAFSKRYQQYGNYKHHPATHIQVADGCWHGKCTFCVENKKSYQIRDFQVVMEEINRCWHLGFREIFDDSGTFPDGKWLRNFCHDLTYGYKYDMKFGCNMRIGADVDFTMMKRAGFRMLLYGIESANQSTLNKIQKGTNAKDIIPTLKEASAAGLEPHIAVMFGQPNESEKEEIETLKLVHYLLRKGYAKTAQASIFRVSGFAGVDRGYCRRIYDVATSPEFWINKLLELKSIDDVKYLLKSIRKGIIRD